MARSAATGIGIRGGGALLHFDMNQLGQATTLANIKSIAGQTMAAGMEVASRPCRLATSWMGRTSPDGDISTGHCGVLR